MEDLKIYYFKELVNILAQIVITALIFIWGRYLVPFLAKNLERAKQNRETALILENAKTVVEAVQQRLSSEEGQKRYNEAIKIFFDMLQKKKIPITQQEAESYIEQAVKNLKIKEEAAKSSVTETCDDTLLEIE